MQSTPMLYIPGLGDENSLEKQRKFVKNWLKSDFFDPRWHSDESLKAKLARLEAELAQREGLIRLCASSAGGSLALMMFAKKPQKITTLTLISAKFRNAPAIGMDYQQRAPQLVAAVRLSEETLAGLTDSAKHQITTVRPLFDDVIPAKEMTIDGAKNRRVLAFGHPLGIIVGILLAKYW